MVTQPQLVVYVTSPAPMRGRTILGTEFRFVRCKRSDVFGTTEHWVEKQEKVVVSDLERTVVDGLKQPEHCGGLTEVAKGLSMRRTDVSATKLVDYALRLGVGAVIRRLGYLMEAYGIGAPEELARLRENLTCHVQPPRSHSPAGGEVPRPMAASPEREPRGDPRGGEDLIDDPAAQPLAPREPACQGRQPASFEATRSMPTFPTTRRSAFTPSARSWLRRWSRYYSGPGAERAARAPAAASAGPRDPAFPPLSCASSRNEPRNARKSSAGTPAILPM